MLLGMVFSQLKIHFSNFYLCRHLHARNSKKRCKICSKLTIKISERRQCRRPDVFIVNFEHIFQFVSVFSVLLNLNRQMKWQKQWHSGKVGCWLHSRCFLVIVADYHIQGKNIRLHSQTHSDLLSLLFWFNHQYLT